MWNIPTGTSSALQKKQKKKGKESQYMVSHPKLCSDQPIGLDRETGCDKLVSEPRFRHFWMSLRLRMYYIVKCWPNADFFVLYID